jgi:hypothetical protein
MATCSLAMTGQTYDDEYVAKLLAQDAKSAKKTYELVGIDAFGSKRCVPTLTCCTARRGTIVIHDRIGDT